MRAVGALTRLAMMKPAMKKISTPAFKHIVRKVKDISRLQYLQASTAMPSDFRSKITSYNSQAQVRSFVAP
jgi:hypothetical protein